MKHRYRLSQGDDGAARSDSFTGSAYADVILTGEGLSHYVMAQGGNDFIQGGSGREYIRAGANVGGIDDNDIVIAGEGTDMVYGGAGEDIIWGNTYDPEYKVTAADSGERGDWLSGENGNDFIGGSRSRDVIFGGAGADSWIAMHSRAASAWWTPAQAPKHPQTLRPIHA